MVGPRSGTGKSGRHFRIDRIEAIGMRLMRMRRNVELKSQKSMAEAIRQYRLAAAQADAMATEALARCNV
jgi:hypothetical protein